MKKTAQTAGHNPSKARCKKKMLLTATGAAVLLIAAGIITVMLLSPTAPPDPRTNPEDAKKFLAGKDFKRLNNAEKVAFMTKFGNERGMFPRPSDNDNLTEEQRKQLRENMRAMFEAMMAERMKTFFAANKDEQLKMLDEDIQRDAEREKQKPPEGGGPGGGPDGGGGPPPDGKGGTPPSPPSAQEQRNHEASSSPAIHAQMQVYMTMKQQRKSGQL